jgi:hypothetical protein
MPEAAIVAVSSAIEAVCKVVLAAMEGQTPEQRAQMWQWFVADVERWRRFLGIEK